MSVDEDSNVAEEVASQPRIAFGEVLRQAREQAGYSQQNVAVELHLKQEIIQAIDDENLDELPEPAYVRGYLRSYARLVGADADAIIEAYSSLNHEAPEWEFNEPARHEVAQGRKLTPVTIFIFVLILGLLVTWLLTEGNGSGTDVDQLSTIETAEPEVVVTEPVQVVESPVLVATPEASETTDILVEEAATEPEAPPVEELANEDELQLEQKEVEEIAVADEGLENFKLASVQAEGTDRVVLRFNNESWAEVMDANDVQLLRGLMKPNTTQELTGTAPFSVFLGNTPAVTILINDVEFDASPYMRRDSVSRFTLKAP